MTLDVYSGRKNNTTTTTTTLIQKKCQGGDKYALQITVKFYQSTRRFGRISYARLFKFTKHFPLLFYFLSPHLLSCIRSTRHVRKKIHFIKRILKFSAQWSIFYDVTNVDVGGIQRGKPGLSRLRHRCLLVNISIAQNSGSRHMYSFLLIFANLVGSQNETVSEYRNSA